MPAEPQLARPKQREQRARRRLRRGFVATSVALVIALLAGAVAVVQRGNARSAAVRATTARRAAEIEALVGRIAALRSTQRDEAALLAIEAFRLADTPRLAFRSAVDVHAESRLSRFAPAATGLRSVLRHRASRRRPRVGDNADHRIRAYNLDTGVLGMPWDPMTNTELRFSQLYASHDSRLLAQIGDDYGTTGRLEVTIGVFDIASRTLRFPAIALPMTVGFATFSPDDKVLVVSGGDNETAIAFDATSGRELGRFTGAGSSPDSNDAWGSAGVAFVGNRRLAIGSRTGRVRILDVPGMTVSREFEMPPDTTRHLDLVDGGRSLLGTGFNGIVRFDATTGKRAWSIADANCPVDTVLNRAPALLLCRRVRPSRRTESRGRSRHAPPRRAKGRGRNPLGGTT